MSIPYQAEIDRAKAEVRRLESKRNQMVARLYSEEQSLANLARLFSVSRPTIRHWINAAERGEE